METENNLSRPVLGFQNLINLIFAEMDGLASFNFSAIN
jgi:hypothetical protein